MKISLTLNVKDIFDLVAAESARRFPGTELDGLNVTSYARTILMIHNGTMIEPVKHHLQEDHKEWK